MFFNKKKKKQPSNRGTPQGPDAEPSFIGRNCVFEGHITSDGELHIDGTVRGTVQAGMCVVDEAGVIHGTVSGNVIHVRGRVLGPIQGSNVFIHAGAHVEGDVFNDTISIENGAYVYGSIRHNSAPAPQGSLAPPVKGTYPAQRMDQSESLPNPENGNGLRVVSTRK